jgi:hypothetical protein
MANNNEEEQLNKLNELIFCTYGYKLFNCGIEHFQRPDEHQCVDENIPLEVKSCEVNRNGSCHNCYFFKLAIKFFKSSQFSQLNNEIFRDKLEDKRKHQYFLITFKVSNMNEVIAKQRLVHYFSKELIEYIVEKQIKKKFFYFETCYKFKDFKSSTEIHEIGNSSRVTLVPGYHGYARQKTRLGVLKTRNSISFIQEALKTGKISVAHKNKIDLIRFLISLPFIRETSRNPATYLMTPMYLELCANYQPWTQDPQFKFFDEFPMAPDGIMSDVRFLHRQHGGIFVYDYEGGGGSVRG